MVAAELIQCFSAKAYFVSLQPDELSMLSMHDLRIAFFATVTLLMASFPAGANVVITIDKSIQRMTVAVDGVNRWRWPVSTGARAYDTPNGTYTAFRMEKDYSSKEWDDAPMPNSIFFTQRGHAIHGSYDKRLGKPISHGCVRLSPGNAAKLFSLVQSQGVASTKVIVGGRIN